MIDRLRITDQELIKKFVWDDEDPDYVVMNVGIHLSNKYGWSYVDKFLKYAKNKNRKRVFIFETEECVEPDLNIFDYAITYSSDLKCADRVFNLAYASLWDPSSGGIYKNDLTPEIAKSRLNNLKFCNFMYSHSSLPRDDYFHAISKYKKVDSSGPYLHNTDIPEDRNNPDWYKLSIKTKSQYKFSIAMETARYYGYNTEKILTSFRAHTIPIYWGDPGIENIYNPKSFINCNKYSSLDEVLNIIKEIDNDDEKYIEMVTQPWQTPEQEKSALKSFQDYGKFINNIFKQDINDAIRRPLGRYPDIWLHEKYLKPYEDHKNEINSLKYLIYKKYKHTKDLFIRVLTKCKRIAKKLINLTMNKK